MRIILRIIFIMFIIVNLFSCTYNDSGYGDGESNPEASNDELVELSDSIPELELVFSSEDVIKNLTQKMSAPSNYSSYIESKVGDIGFYVAVLNFMIRKYKQYVKDNAHNMAEGKPIEINQTSSIPISQQEINFHKLKYSLLENVLKIYWVFYLTNTDPEPGEPPTFTGRLYIKLERDPEHNGFYIADYAMNFDDENNFCYLKYSTYTKTLINYENWQVDTGTAENYREYYLIDRANAHYKYLEYLVHPDSTPDTKITVIIANNDGRYIYDSTIDSTQGGLVFYDNNGNLGTPPGPWDELNNLKQDWLEERAPGEIDKYTPSELLPGSDSPEFSDLY